MEEGKVFLQIYYSSAGFIGLAASAKGIMRLILPQESEHLVREELCREFPEGKFHRFPWRQLFTELEEYFKSGRQTFNVPLDLHTATDFQKEVYQELAKVPAGQVISYQELAERLGKPNAARAVAQALASNPVPLLIPCHRVIASDGDLAGFSAPGGVAQKRSLLEKEGIAFTPAGKVKK